MTKQEEFEKWGKKKGFVIIACRTKDESANGRCYSGIIQDMWEAWQSASGKAWIPVEEKLPPEGEIVLVYEDGKVCTNWIPYANTIHESQRGKFQSGHDYVTHWQPLPAVPDSRPSTEGK